MPPGKGSGQFHGHQHPRPPRVLHFFFLEEEKQMRKKPDLRARWMPQEPPPQIGIAPPAESSTPRPQPRPSQGCGLSILGELDATEGATGRDGDGCSCG